MSIGVPYLLLIIAGLAGVFWGFPAAHRGRGFRDILAALVALVGVVMTALGILLTIIPSFFG